MAIIQATNVSTGLVGVTPSIIYLNTTDNLATALTAGYLNQLVSEGAISVSNSTMALVNLNGSSNTVGKGNPIWLACSVTGPSAPLTYSLVNPTAGGPSVFTDVTSLAAPGTIRSLTGSMTETATTMTSGNLVGVRGSVTAVGASGGYLYGTQGKVIASGTLSATSGTCWTAGVFGQLDISAANINGGETAPIWGDYGSASGTITSGTGMFGIAMTNTTAATLQAQVYLQGKATNLFQLSGSSSTYISAATTGALSGTVMKIAISIDGATYYIPVATVVA